MRALLLLTFLAGAAHAEPVDSVAARADRYLAARTALGRFSGAALIARGPDVRFARGYGYADIARRTLFTPDTRIRIASLTKMFTAMSALVLRDQGRLALDDTLGKWLPDAPSAWRPITLEQLIHHTSGIPDYEEALEMGSAAYFAEMTRPDATARIVAHARTLPLDFAPGSKFRYSNTAYVVLAHVVERAAGQPFASYVERTLLGPAGMKDSGMFDGRTTPRGLALGYTHGNPGWDRMLSGIPLTDTLFRRVPELPLAPPAGDGGMYATARDLFRWSRVMEGRAPVGATRAREALTPGKSDYGFGWIVDRAFDRVRQRHAGILPGALATFVRFPAESLTIVVVANDDRVRMEKVVRDLSAIALGKEWDLPVSGRVATLAKSDYARLEGDYALADGRSFTVKKDEDLLTVHLEGRFTAGLIPLDPTTFYFPLGDGRATFALEDGRPVRLNLRYDGEDHVGTRR